MKQIDILSTTAAFNTTGTVNPLNGTAIGSSFFNRIGRKIQMLSLELEGIVSPIAGNTTTQGDYARILIVYDKQVNGSLPAISDVLLDQSATATSTTALSGYNYNNEERFDILYDRGIYLPTTNGVPSSETDYAIKIIRDIEGYETQYKADSAALSDIATGALYIITLGTLVAGSEGFALGYRTRVVFNDL